MSPITRRELLSRSQLKLENCDAEFPHRNSVPHDQTLGRVVQGEEGRIKSNADWPWQVVGRKPLILVRACILGMLMPASDDPKKDREIFLNILTMDDEGTWQRQKGNIPVKAWREAAPAEIQDKYFGAQGFQRWISEEEKEFVLTAIWEELSS